MEVSTVTPPVKHERWATPFDFLIACTGAAIGYGNVWRFPFLVYKNGGGAFLIPFFISVILGALPVFYLEVVQGQFMSSGTVNVWKMAPLFKGIGFASLIIIFYENCYYNILLTWSFRYLFASFTTELPWSSCGNEWNTDMCIDGSPASVFDAELNQTIYISANNSTTTSLSNLQDSATEYWENQVLGITQGIEHMGSIKPDLLGCLALAWVVVFLCISKGIKTSGRVMYFTATAPYLIMIILLIRGLMLPGAMKGVEFYMNPDFSKIWTWRVWADAGTQVFFSYAVSIGVLHAFGSFNPWHHNCFRDSFLFSIVDTFTCILAGFVIFPVLGFMAEQKGVSIDEVAEQGPGLVFVVYPKAVSMMPLAPIWSILFFAMLIFIGIDSQFCDVEGFCTAIIDMFPYRLVGTAWRRAGFVASVCFINFLMGLTMITNGGMYVFQILDYYSGSRIILVVAMAECLVVGWVYGTARFTQNMEIMWNRKMPKIFHIGLKIMWNYVTPGYVFAQFILNSIIYSQNLEYKRTENNIYVFPSWAVILGWTIAYSSVIAIPLVAAVKVFNKWPEGQSFAEVCPYLPCFYPDNFVFINLASEAFNYTRVEKIYGHTRCPC